ncbi:hypothetical protein, partial [Achromobacter sp.]|uniref:hypothetical protein n=1 Tax=Achromobacter sp. TaxID=134375 RepID=UPI00257F365A
PGKPLIPIASQAQDYSTIFADCATGFCLIRCNPCNNRFAAIPGCLAAGWVDFLADHCRGACGAVLSSPLKTV